MENNKKVEWTTIIANGLMFHQFSNRVLVTYNFETTWIKVFKDGEIIRTISNITNVADYANFLDSVAKDTYTLDCFDNSKDE